MYKKFKGFCKAQTILKYLPNRNENRIKTVLKAYFNLQYYFKTVCNDNFKRIKKKQI